MTTTLHPAPGVGRTGSTFLLPTFTKEGQQEIPPATLRSVSTARSNRANHQSAAPSPTQPWTLAERWKQKGKKIDKQTLDSCPPAPSQAAAAANTAAVALVSLRVLGLGTPPTGLRGSRVRGSGAAEIRLKKTRTRNPVSGPGGWFFGTYAVRAGGNGAHIFRSVREKKM
jgi:hypothetical protein